MAGTLAQLRERAADAEQRAKRLSEMLEFAEKLGDEGIAEFVAMIAANENGNEHANGNGHDTEKQPRGREAIRLVVHERPGVWTLAALRAELRQRGWFTSHKALGAAISRLVSDGEAKHAGRGRYAFLAPREEDAIESDLSDGAMIPLSV